MPPLQLAALITRCSIVIARPLGMCVGLKPSEAKAVVCVLSTKLVFPPVYIQHNQCPCRCLLEKRALLLLWSQTTRQKYTSQTQQGALRPFDTNRNEHEGKKKEGQHTRLLATTDAIESAQLSSSLQVVTTARPNIYQGRVTLRL